MSDLPSTDASSNGAAAELNLQAPPELVTPDDVSVGGPEQEPGDGDSDIESPAKIIRIGAMVKQLLEEARNTSIADRIIAAAEAEHAQRIAVFYGYMHVAPVKRALEAKGYRVKVLEDLR